MKKDNKKKIIITGTAGLVGLNLLTQLNPNIYNVIGIDQNEHNINLAEKIFPEFKFITADVSKSGEWQESFKDAYCIIQLQAQISHVKKQPYIKNNILAVEKIIETCKKYKIKNLIHLSSSVVISVADDNYTNTKRKGEEIVKSSKIPYTIVRPTLMYGCFDIKHLGFMSNLVDISPVFPIPGSGKYTRQPLFVLDICDIIIKLIESKPKNKIYNIVGKEKIYFIDLIKIIAKEKKRKILFLKIPTKIFLFLLKVHSLITGKRIFVSAQLAALQNNDIFPVNNWDKTFNINYTPFTQGIKKVINSPYYKYKKDMKKFD